jgi:nucleoside-diphosphate-sugar epimerase
MKIALIGASSFLGKNIVEYIDTNIKNCELSATYNKNYNFDQNLSIKNKSLNLIKINLNFESNILNLNFIKNTDLIIFAAGISKPKKISIDDYNIINVNGLKKILQKITNKQKLIVISSTEAVGPNSSEKPFDEKQECNPSSNYGKSKLQMERLCFEYISKGYDINIIRPTTIFGKHNKEFLKFFKLNKFRIFPIRSKKKCIEYLHVSDLIKLIFFMYESKIPSGLYNISPKNKVSLNDILINIEKKTQKKWSKIYLPKNIMKIFFKNTVSRLTEFYFNSSSSKIEQLGFEFNAKTFDEYVLEVYNHFKKNEQI